MLVVQKAWPCASPSLTMMVNVVLLIALAALPMLAYGESSLLETGLENLRKKGYCVEYIDSNHQVRFVQQIESFAEGASSECTQALNLLLSQDDVCTTPVAIALHFRPLLEEGTEVCDLLRDRTAMNKVAEQRIIALTADDMAGRGYDEGSKQMVSEYLKALETSSFWEGLWKVFEKLPEATEWNEVRDWLLFYLTDEDAEQVIISHMLGTGIFDGLSSTQVRARLSQLYDGNLRKVWKVLIRQEDATHGRRVRFIVEQDHLFHEIKDYFTFAGEIDYDRAVSAVAAFVASNADTGDKEFVAFIQKIVTEYDPVSVFEEIFLPLQGPFTVAALKEAILTFADTGRMLQAIFEGSEDFGILASLEPDDIPAHFCRGRSSIADCLLRLRIFAKQIVKERAAIFQPKYTSNPLFGGECRTEDFKTIRALGSGGFGAVRLAEHQKLGGGNLFAVKKIAAAHIPKIVEFLRKEQDLQNRVVHKHIAPLHCVMRGKNGSIYLVMPYYEGEDLLQRLLDGQVFSHDELRQMAQQLIKALRALHKSNIAHLDVKPENLLLDAAGNVILIDFGLAEYDWGGGSLTGSPGTPTYAAPEILTGSPYGRAADYYSLAVTLYVLATASFPYAVGKNLMQFGMELMFSNQAPIPKTGNAELDDLIQILGQAFDFGRWEDAYENFDEKIKCLPLFAGLSWDD